MRWTGISYHYDENLSSPFSVLAAMAARTSAIELGRVSKGP